MKIGNYTINKDSPVFIIAELSANHNGSIDTAIETVKAAKRANFYCRYDHLKFKKERF